MPRCTPPPARKALLWLFAALLLPLPAFQSDGPATLAGTTHFSGDGYRGVDFRDTAPAADDSPLTRHGRVVLRGDYAYFLNVVPVTGPADGSQGTGKAFLASLRAKA